MTQPTTEIVQKLKDLSLFEAADLVTKLEERFGIDLRDRRTVLKALQGNVQRAPIAAGESHEEKSEKLTFDVVLEAVAADKRVASLKRVRALTDLGLKEAKEFCSHLPRVVKKAVSKEDAEEAKKSLEETGRKVTIQLIEMSLQ